VFRRALLFKIPVPIMHSIPNRTIRVLQIAGLLVSLSPLLRVSPSPVQADIFQWEYVDPADPSQGKRQSTTLAPDGAGVDAVPGAYLVGRNLTMADLIGADLREVFARRTNFTDADLSQSNLTNAGFGGATLTDADFTGAEVEGASFGTYASCGLSCAMYGTGITLAQLYATASYQAHDLNGISFWGNDLSGGNFADQNLTNATFDFGTLTDADFTDAEVRGASFSGAGLTTAQLASTASYQAQDLTGIRLDSNDLSGWNFAGQNLTNASFGFANLTGAEFTDAEIRGAELFTLTGFTLAQLYSTASYRAHDLSGIALHVNNLTGGNFAGQTLTNAIFYGATLTGAEFTDAEVRGANFGISRTGDGTGVSLAQLYSTASYKAQDLSGIELTYNNLAGGNFAGQNLTNANFRGAYLAGANFRGANLANVRFVSPDYGFTTLTDTDFSAADTRGADDFSPPFSATTTNMISRSGHIDGIDLDAGGLLVVRDYDGDPRSWRQLPPRPITIDKHMAMGPGGTLRMVFEADAWDSTISFAPGIPVTLGGTLELTFANEVNLASQVGRTFDLFDWTGVNPTGGFTISSQYTWDLSNLCSTGEVTLIAVPEPQALFMLGFALTALVAMGRLRVRFF
jgi:uncharacterized protein YjbI with pentapeptide repeats